MREFKAVKAQRQSTRAFSLFEILIIVLIVGILFALVQPALRSGLMEGRRGQATSDGRQLWGALMLYRESNQEKFPPLGPAALPRNLLAGIADYREDPTEQGYANFIIDCRSANSVRGDERMSWESLHDGTLSSMDSRLSYLLERLDQNPGILALRVFGDRGSVGEFRCDRAPTAALVGPYLRVRLDGSVARKVLQLETTVGREPGEVFTSIYFYSLFTDNPAHKN
ncbi:MAG: hypothetical protein KF884_08240 [Fimbriimonadaceae bacterium]|nr:hypothetical protein [Fimbriimonadaceae bacterium]QYK57539.1 MAG: hypothetical protein KF884_08240 [Fimbriimonadaceae bacterium]